MELMILVAAGVMLAIGLGLLVGGLRGLPVPPDPSQPADEGGKPAKPKTKPSPALVVLGVLLILPPLGLAGLIASALLGDGDLNKIKPTWMLVSEFGNKDPDVAADAYNSYLDRLKADGVGASAVAGLADKFLSEGIKASDAEAFSKRRIIEMGRGKKMIGDEQWKKYVRARLDFGMTARGRIALGEALPIEIRNVGKDLDHASEMVHYLSTPTAVQIGPAKLTPADLAAAHGDAPRNSRLGAVKWTERGYDGNRDVSIPTAAAKDLQPGKHELRVDWKVQAFDAKGDGKTPVAEWEVPLTAQVEVLPAGQASTKLLAGDELRKKVSARVLSVTITPDGKLASVILYVAAPVDSCFDVYLRHGGQEQFVVQTVNNCELQPTIPWKFTDLKAGDKIEAVFRPNAKAAAGRVTLIDIWGEEVVDKDVKILAENTEGPGKTPSSKGDAPKTDAPKAPAKTEPAAK